MALRPDADPYRSRLWHPGCWPCRSHAWWHEPWQPDSWEDVVELTSTGEEALVVSGARRPTLEIGVGGRLRLDDEVGGLRAQDRRRLHRLGLRQSPGTSSWTWSVPERTAPLRDLAAHCRDVVEGCRLAGELAAQVLRDALLLTPDQLLVHDLAGLEAEDPWEQDADLDPTRECW